MGWGGMAEEEGPIGPGHPSNRATGRLLEMSGKGCLDGPKVQSKWAQVTCCRSPFLSPPGGGPGGPLEPGLKRAIPCPRELCQPQNNVTINQLSCPVPHAELETLASNNGNLVKEIMVHP